MTTNTRSSILRFNCNCINLDGVNKLIPIKDALNRYGFEKVLENISFLEGTRAHAYLENVDDVLTYIINHHKLKYPKNRIDQYRSIVKYLDLGESQLRELHSITIPSTYQAGEKLGTRLSDWLRGVSVKTVPVRKNIGKFFITNLEGDFHYLLDNVLNLIILRNGNIDTEALEEGCINIIEQYIELYGQVGFFNILNDVDFVNDHVEFNAPTLKELAEILFNGEEQRQLLVETSIKYFTAITFRNYLRGCLRMAERYHAPRAFDRVNQKKNHNDLIQLFKQIENNMFNDDLTELLDPSI